MTPSAADEGRTKPWSLRELVAELRAGTTTFADALAQCRARIEATDPELRAWVALDPAPDPATAVGPLSGVPLGVKDIIDVAGMPTKCGSPTRAEASPTEADAAIVAAWRQAGAVPVGKTVTTEFAFFTPGPTRNPAAPGHTPGGSSSGSAAAVSSGQVPLALGSQTAGSVTRPASFCGVASLAMSHGRFPVTGVAGLSPSLDTHGVFAANVSDVALAWSALAGVPDPLRPTGNPPRLLVWTADALGVVDPEMRGALETVRDRLAAAGAVVEDFPEEQLVAEVLDAHPVVMAYEAARERATELRVVSQLSPQLAELLQTGADIPDQDYKTARQTVADARTRIVPLLESCDAVLGPAAPGPAPAGLGSTGDPALSRAWQALGLPAVTMPGQRTEAGLPLGVQFLGRVREEAALLTTACWAESVQNVGG